ncbi:MAG: adenosine deaminase [Ardenticatenales bacterium]|nr:adenosine deaminase [Ardenticatenales bacterium]
MNAANDLKNFIQAMPKAELHIHLEGTVKPATLLQLAQRNGLQKTLPSTTVAGLQEWFTFRDFPHFIEVILAVHNLLRTKEDFALAAYENGAAMHAQNIRYRELTVSPFNHTTILDKGLSIADILAGLEEGRRQARADFGVEMRWVFDVARNFCFAAPNSGYDPVPAEETLKYAMAGQPYGVVALGLGGGEVGCPPEPFAPTFARAKEAGLYSVPHAGETVGPASVWGAVEALQADRLGHGVRAIEDPYLLARLHEQQIPLEICLSSNQCLHVYDRIEGHPLPHLDRMRLPVTVNTDDPPIFNTTLCGEYELLAESFGYDQADITRIARNAFAYSLAEPELKATLLGEFDAWVERR